MACLNWLTGFNGEMYLRGHGVEKNAQKAAELLVEARARGDAAASRVLSEMYVCGDGVEHDVNTALLTRLCLRATVPGVLLRENELWAHQVQTEVLEMNRVQLTSALHCM